MDSDDGYQEVELTDSQKKRIRVAFAKKLCWDDAGIDPDDYLPFANELMEIVVNVLYYPEGQD